MRIYHFHYERPQLAAKEGGILFYFILFFFYVCVEQKKASDGMSHFLSILKGKRIECKEGIEWPHENKYGKIAIKLEDRNMPSNNSLGPFSFQFFSPPWSASSPSSASYSPSSNSSWSPFKQQESG